MFDSHCHLNDPEFIRDLDAVIVNAKNAGIENILIPSTNLKDSKRAVIISETYKGIYSAVGIHPTEDLEKLDLDRVIVQIEELSSSAKVKAIGEIGLDYYRYSSPSSLQKTFFIEQLRLAMRLDKSLIIHTRQSAADMIEVLKKNWTPSLSSNCVFHCCEADDELLDFAIVNRIFIGVDGDVTYDGKKADFIRKVPIELLVVETDSPVLLPEPLRSDRTVEKVLKNEPKNLGYIIAKIAEMKNEETESIAKVTSDNARTLFAIA